MGVEFGLGDGVACGVEQVGEDGVIARGRALCLPPEGNRYALAGRRPLPFRHAGELHGPAIAGEGGVGRRKLGERQRLELSAAPLPTIQHCPASILEDSGCSNRIADAPALRRVVPSVALKDADRGGPLLGQIPG